MISGYHSLLLCVGSGSLMMLVLLEEFRVGLRQQGPICLDSEEGMR